MTGLPHRLRIAGAAALVLAGLPGGAGAFQVDPVTPSPWTSPALSQVPLPEWLSLSGEVRMRMENRSGLGFRDGVSDTYGLLRTRLNVDVRPHSNVHLYFQAQDARAPGILESRANGVFRDPMDLRQAYLRVGPGEGFAAFTVGRQLLLYGDQRLVGPLDWTNTSRAFDAGKLQIRTALFDLDVFSGWVVQNDPSRTLNRSDRSSGFHGAYGRVRLPWASLAAEPFVLWRETPSVAGGGDRYSGGVRIVGRRGGLESSVTFVEQWGNLAATEIRARALSASVGYAFTAPLAPRVLMEFNYASGDDDPADGTLESFDDLYPTAHLFYGYNDLVGMRNIQNLRIGAGVAPFTGVTASADFHVFRLATVNDGLYGVSGAESVAAPLGGAPDRAIGEELDLTINWRVTETVSLTGGVGHFFPGPFVRSNTGGAANTFTHAALSVRF